MDRHGSNRSSRQMEQEALKRGFMEFVSFIPESRLSIPQEVLLKAAENSQIHTFGWPIGIVLNSREDRPVPYADGIKATVHVKDRWFGGRQEESFDYWSLKKNGDYYLIKSLFEDARGEGIMFFDTRIVRIAETFMHTALLYRQLE